MEQSDTNPYMPNMYSQPQTAPQAFPGQPTMGYPPPQAPQNNLYSKGFNQTLPQHYIPR